LEIIVRKNDCGSPQTTNISKIFPNLVSLDIITRGFQKSPINLGFSGLKNLTSLHLRGLEFANRGNWYKNFSNMLSLRELRLTNTQFDLRSCKRFARSLAFTDLQNLEISEILFSAATNAFGLIDAILDRISLRFLRIQSAVARPEASHSFVKLCSVIRHSLRGSNPQHFQIDVAGQYKYSSNSLSDGRVREGCVFAPIGGQELRDFDVRVGMPNSRIGEQMITTCKSEKCKFSRVAQPSILLCLWL
jgi:hypothetical protein